MSDHATQTLTEISGDRPTRSGRWHVSRKPNGFRSISAPITAIRSDVDGAHMKVLQRRASCATIGMRDACDVDVSIATVQAAIVSRDWITVRPMLHPYMHWTDTHGRVVRGRSKVLAMLAESDPPTLPSEVEWRDGQVYRWTA